MRRLFTAAVAAALLLGGCAQVAETTGIDCRTLTTTTGAVGGAVLGGYFFGGGTGKIGTTALGGLLGGTAGYFGGDLLACPDHPAMAKAAPPPQ
jgi:hypothetical protein